MTRPLPVWPDAACRDSALDFVPDSEAPHVVRPLKAVCLDCRHRVECAELAIADPNAFGVWGALTTDERRSIRAGRHITA